MKCVHRSGYKVCSFICLGTNNLKMVLVFSFVFLSKILSQYSFGCYATAGGALNLTAKHNERGRFKHSGCILVSKYVFYISIRFTSDDLLQNSEETSSNNNSISF
uniref:Uncharacterized protein n=1 Tax=Schistocephalus solidus TaxID=70667 RepID=A0A0X3PH05_SCHSO